MGTFRAMTTSTRTTTRPTSPVAGQLLGYARISTGLQEVALQLDALAVAGCVRVWTETASGGAGTQRPELAALLEYARPGDVVVVWRLDRLGRSLRELVDLVEQLREREVVLRSLHEGIDTSTATAAGRMQLHLFAVLAEYERDLLLERTGAGLAAAKARGRAGGRPSVMTAAKVTAARAMHAEGASLADIAAAVGVAKTTVRRHLVAVAVSSRSC